jgi:hypothetical protein
MWAERDYVKEELTHLRLRRNRVIHHAHHPDDAESLMNCLRKFVEELLLLLLHKDVLRLDWDEVTELLNRAPDVALLRKQRKVLNLAIRFHS